MDDEITIIMPAGALGANEHDDALDTALRKIAVAASKDSKREWADKYGTCFENDVFMIHNFCWCEQESCGWCGEENNPNFHYKPNDFMVWWYKYIGRSTETEGEIDIEKMMKHCLESLDL